MTDEPEPTEQVVDQAAEARDAQVRIAAQLTGLYTSLVRGGGWDAVPPYLLRSLPRHAAEAGLIDELLADKAYVCHADLRYLALVADHAITPEGRACARIIHLTPQALSARPAERAAMFSVTEALELAGDAFRKYKMPAIPYRGLWAWTRPRHERAVLAGQTDELRAVCPVPLRDGRILLATAGGDSTVRLWDPATGAEEAIFEGHTGHVAVLCSLSLPGERTILATAGGDSTVRLWDPNTGTAAEPPLTGHTAEVTAACPVPLRDGRTLLATAGGDSTVRLWDPATGAEEAIFEGHTGHVAVLCSLSLPGERTILATAGGDSTVRLWDPNTGTAAEPPLTGHTAEVTVACPVPLRDGRTLLATAGGDSTVRLWDPATGAEEAALESDAEGSAFPRMARFARLVALCPLQLPDGRTLLAAASRSFAESWITLWDPDARHSVRTLAYRGRISTVCVMPLRDGSILLATIDSDSFIGSAIRLWDPITGTCVRTMQNLDYEITDVCAIRPPNGPAMLVTADNRGMVRLWEPNADVPEIVFQHEEGPHAVRALCTLTNHNGRALLAVATTNGGIHFLDLATGASEHALNRAFPSSSIRVRSMCELPMPDGRNVLAVGGDFPGADANTWDEVQLWDLVTATSSTVLRFLDCSIYAVNAVPIPDGQILLAAGGYDVVLWHPTKGRQRSWDRMIDAMCPLPIRDGRTLLATARDLVIQLWDPLTGTEERQIQCQAGKIRAMCPVPTPHGYSLLATATDLVIQLWDPLTGTEERQIQCQAGNIRAMCPLPRPHGRILLAAAVSRQLEIWDPLTGQCLLVIPVHHLALRIVAVKDQLVVGLDAGVITIMLPDHPL